MNATLTSSANQDTLASTDVTELLARDIEFVAGLPFDMMEDRSFDDLGLDQTSILTPEVERALFEQMNFAYFRAAAVQHVVDPDEPDAALVERLVMLLDRGDSIRNLLMVVFHKLTVSIAKNFVSPRHSLDELASEGDTVLLRAIARFDPSRGFRFSTYATYALRRRIVRYLQSGQHVHAVPVDMREAPPIVDTCRWTPSYERRVLAGMDWVESALQELNTRQRYVIRCRFGWGQEFEPRTLQEIADELGISRERVRQIEARALQILQQLATSAEVM